MLSWLRISARDPASWLHAAINGWKYPLSREGQILLELYDLTLAINSSKKKPKPSPRPWQTGQRISATAVPIEEARERLAGRGMKQEGLA
ncbi:hypothetical protein [Mycetocola saprophilus]|uniref:hypothetical protein n=1 Tax=Mycetocola saprophilus TaxID=76636 RepID=UPI0012DCCD50|nr:hypothetical protein [Mycetocola saprophilus]